MNKKINSVQNAPKSRSMGPYVKQVIPSALEHADPFVFLDHFGPMVKQVGEQGVPPHPHAGIATVTYLFEGRNRHQDSYGHDAIIEAGDIAWMQAGKGIIHSEGMNENQTEPMRIHGLQLWISLPAKDKFIEPKFYHYPSNTLPSFEEQGANLKVLCGSFFAHTSPVQSLSPAYIVEVKMKANSEIEIPIPEGHTCGLYLISGSISSDGSPLQAFDIAGFSETGNSIKLEANTESHLILLGGKPLNEPIVAYASFVMNSKEQIIQVIHDYQDGKMGQL
jgi:redox-sensitive bicupin YhaK (pirin superfamily)